MANANTAPARGVQPASRRRAGLGCLALTLLLSLTPSESQAADALGAFTGIAGARTDNELPSETGGSAASVTRTMRPALGYPSLRLRDRLERRWDAQDTGDAAAAPAAPALPAASSGFEQLVAQTLGQPLPVFGADLLADENAFPSLDHTGVPADFLIGPGDELLVQAWGSIELDVLTTVSRDGAIVLPKVGEIPVAGVAFAELDEHLAAALGRIYHGFELSVGLGRVKPVQVYVTGFASAPGSHTLSGFATLTSAVLQSGGPAASGDPRRIELRRNGARLVEMDLYDFLVRGDRGGDVRLQTGDVVHIPAMAGQVAVAGSVQRAGIYHLALGETLADLMAHAGGLSTTADRMRLIVERITPEGGRRIVEGVLDDNAGAQALQAGDLVLISPISPRFDNAVTLRGQVARPLRHQWTPGMRVSDLIPDVEALISPAYWIRRNSDDQVTDLLDASAPAPMNPEFPDIDWDYAVIERIERDDLEVTLLPFQLGRAVRERDPAHDLALRPGDTITVFSRGDFRKPVASERRFVRIEGEVAHGGIYPMGPDDRLADLIERAGGLTDQAFVYGTEFTRESVRRQQEKRMHESINSLEQEYQRHLIDRSRNVLSGDLSLAIPPEADAIRGLIASLREARPSGRIVFELDTGVGGVADLPHLRLEDLDRVYIPPRPDTVEIVGAVLQTGSVLHDPERSLREYTDNAGLIPTADRSRVYVVRADGSFETAGRRFRAMPGDTIVVPERTDRETTVRMLKDWTQVLYQFGLGAAGLMLLVD